MKVRDFMKTDLITVERDTPIMEALKVMRKHRIKRLPVMRRGRFVGLVTRSMIRDASPSPATSLSVYELNYLISKMTVGEIMVKEPRTISPDLPVEEAIWLGREHGIGAFPVVEADQLVGIITESDITGVVIDALGLAEPDSRRLTIELGGRRFGVLKELALVLDEHRIPLRSIMSVPRRDAKGWHLILRVKARDAAEAARDLRSKGFEVREIT